MFEFHTVETDQAEWFLNYTAFSFLITEAIDTQNKTEANQTGCGVEEYGDNLELWRAKFPVTIADANPPCGGKKDGTVSNHQNCLGQFRGIQWNQTAVYFDNVTLA